MQHIDRAIDSADLRRAFARFGTGVTVVTSRAQGGDAVGVTVNSFNTVSLEPPIVLWSLALRSPSLAAFRAAGHFVVNVLTVEQLDLSRRFSKPAADKFAGLAFTQGATGGPVLAGCAATLECALLSEQVVGDHVLFLGHVQHYAYAQADPLLFCNGNYQQGVELALPCAA